MRTNRLRKRSLQASRPSLPVPCVLAIACAAGIFLSEPTKSMLDVVSVRVLIGAVVCASIAILVILFRSNRAVVWGVLFFVIAGLALGCSQLSLLEKQRAEAPADTERYHFILSADSSRTLYGSQVRATIDGGALNGQEVLLFLKTEEQLYTGDLVQTDTCLSVPSEEYLAYYDQRGIALSADVGAFQRAENPTWLSPVYQLRERLLNILGSGSDEQTLLRAILLGERSSLFDAGFYHSIKVAGLAHLVAVSGAHLVIIAGFVSLLLRTLHVPARIGIALQCLFLVVYLILVGFPVSCIRAASMSAITLFALLVKRRSSSLTALGITTIVMMVLDPVVVYQLSFQLSVAATFGIVLFMPLFVEWFATLTPKMPEFVRESIRMTLAALIFSLPISAAQFSLVPLLSPLANLIATPYLTVLLMFGFAALLFSSVAPFLLGVLSFLAKGLIIFFGSIEAIPGASIPVSISIAFALPVVLASAVVAWLWWPTPRKRKTILTAQGHDAPERYESVRRFRRRNIVCIAVVALIGVIAIGGLRASTEGDRIIMLDVGQGDSFAFTSEGKTILVDTGNETEMFYSALARSGIARIDAVVITHPDDDHCGNLSALSGVMDVGRVVIAEGLDEVEDEKVESFIAQARGVVGADGIVEVKAGDSLRFGAFTLDIVAPDSIEHEGGNEDSICFYARIDCDRDGRPDWNAFFCGDAESEVLEALDGEHLLESVDLYKVGHHGSRKALTSELAEKLSPKISLIGVGENTYGHPTQETISNLEAVGSCIYRSDLCGNVVCTFTLDAIELSSDRVAA